ncbi:NADH dehydrogenase [Thiohalorhabdus denitrificans]|uniref:NADH-quinone oxidoreductase subunit E n=1 Tax=Thiohalorhabdus denitrificans TaxID=381306 RepID=A0A0P9EDT4_9GAMM|nr:NADH-quinone oxidoreductase subunit NuoE [Thiohalorhabdus denitrificans]KPV40498.1 NADH dehydrogenase [Thiohalorhabdus denitrificans]SCY62416.1 NADH dehydrogenase subunit E [Thiohalorhabdus denitrificans]
MLSEAERQAIAEERERWADPRAAGVEALKAVQEHQGWVSDEALAEAAEVLGMPVAELDGVATFYNLIFRKPVGRHVILVCDSVSCWLVGQEPLYAALQQRLGIAPGQTTEDGRFTLLPVCCLGRCERAPALLIDGEPVGDVSPERLDDLLERYP